MARTKIKWVLVTIMLTLAFTNSLPISQPLFTTTDSITVQIQSEEIKIESYQENDINGNKTKDITIDENVKNETQINTTSLIARNVRPGQIVTNYDIVITRNGGSFQGRAVMDVELTAATQGDPIVFNIEDLQINNVLVGVFTDLNAVPAEYDADDTILEIDVDVNALNYVVIVEYTIPASSHGYGLYTGQYDDK